MKKTYAMAAALAGLMFTACNDSDFDGYTKAENGLHYKFFNQNEDGVKAQEGEGISIRYILKSKSKDSTFFDSKNSNPEGVNQLMLQKSTVYGGIEDALKMMAKGDSAEFILNADSFFLKTNGSPQLPPFIKPGDHLVFAVKMVDIRSKKELEENQKAQRAEQEAKLQVMKEKEVADMDKYLVDNKITAKPQASGLIFIETKKGTGASPDTLDMVKVHYHGTFLDGNVFDSSVKRGEPMVTGLTFDRIIRAWTLALPQMKKGGKAKIIVPSELAYGMYGYNGIPPYTPLVFELELVDINPPAETAPMPGQ